MFQPIQTDSEPVLAAARARRGPVLLPRNRETWYGAALPVLGAVWGLLEPVLTLLECPQHRQLQPVLVATRGLLRPDDVIQGRDPNGNAQHRNQGSPSFPLGVVTYSRGIECDVQIAEPRY